MMSKITIIIIFFSNAGNSWYLQQMEIADYYIVIPKVCQNSVPVNQIFIFLVNDLQLFLVQFGQF